MERFYAVFLLGTVLVAVLNGVYFLTWARAAEDDAVRRRRLLLFAVAAPLYLAFLYLLARFAASVVL